MMFAGRGGKIALLIVLTYLKRQTQATVRGAARDVGVCGGFVYGRENLREQ